MIVDEFYTLIPSSPITYIATDGKVFTDRSEYMKHVHELNMRKLEIINKRSWFETGIAWILLGVFVVGFLFGVFISLNSN